MKKERNIGQEILAGIREIKEWQQGKKKLKTTRIQLPRAADVAKIRQNLDLTQDEFADFMGVKVKTLQNWEQKRREPQGPARSLLRVAEKTPEAILKALPRSTHRLGAHHHGTHKRKPSSG
jgi:putative transcriptional regulator